MRKSVGRRVIPALKWVGTIATGVGKFVSYQRGRRATGEKSVPAESSRAAGTKAGTGARAGAVVETVVAVVPDLPIYPSRMFTEAIDRTAMNMVISVGHRTGLKLAQSVRAIGKEGRGHGQGSQIGPIDHYQVQPCLHRIDESRGYSRSESVRYGPRWRDLGDKRHRG